MKRIAAAIAALSSITSVHAATIQAGNTPGGDNVIFNACTAPIFGPSLAIEGCLNTDHNLNVRSTGTENLIANGGQARVESADGAFTQLTIEFANATIDFSQLVLNINAAGNGQVTFSAMNSIGFITPTIWNVSAGGSNFFTLLAGAGETFRSVTFTSNVAIQDVRQVRLVQARGAAVPEPASFGLLGLGLVGMAMARRRRS